MSTIFDIFFKRILSSENLLAILCYNEEQKYKSGLNKPKVIH